MPGALDKLSKTASKLITKFGKTATLTRVTKTQNQTTGTSTETIATEPVIITPPEPFNFSRRPDSDQRGFANTTITKGDFRCMVAADDVDPVSIGDRLTIDSSEFQIVDHGTLWAGEIAAAYELGLEQ